MALDSINEKLAVMEWGDSWEPGLPMVSTSTIDQADKQQLLVDYPGILWSAGSLIPFILDMNTRLFVYLKTFYTEGAGADLTTMMSRYLRGLTGDYDTRFRKLIQDAS